MMTTTALFAALALASVMAILPLRAGCYNTNGQEALWSLGELASFLSGEIYLNGVVNNRSYDVPIHGFRCSNESVLPGELFVIVPRFTPTSKKERKQYFNNISKSGAVALLVGQLVVESQLPQIVLNRSSNEAVMDALKMISRRHRNKFDIPIIAITGSVGKTTTNRMVESILVEEYGAKAVLAGSDQETDKWSLAVLMTRMRSWHRAVTVETALGGFGQLDACARLLSPISIAVVTCAAANHLDELKNISGVATAKSELITGLPNDENTTVVLNLDDQFYPFWLAKAWPRHVLTFGKWPSPATVQYTVGNPFQIRMRGGVWSVHLKHLLGGHNAANAAAATAVASQLGIDPETIRDGLEKTAHARGRMHVHPFPNDVTLVDDSFNSCQPSIRAAVDQLSRMIAKRRILILGDMDYPSDTVSVVLELHREMVVYAKRHRIDILMAVGPMMSVAAADFGMGAVSFLNEEDMFEHLVMILQPRDLVLFKCTRRSVNGGRR